MSARARVLIWIVLILMLIGWVTTDDIPEYDEGMAVKLRQEAERRATDA